MEFLKNIGKAFGEAASFVGEKSRKAAYVNRIRTVIQCEEKSAEKEYLALGRYYYNNLRDKNNAVTEPHCAELEAIEERLDKALGFLEKYYSANKEQCEEITLDDVESYDQEPSLPEQVAAQSDFTMEQSSAVSQEGDILPQTAAPATEAASPEENDSLPFEG